MTLTTRVGTVIVVQHYANGSAFIANIHSNEPAIMFGDGPDALMDAINAADDIAMENGNWSADLIGHMYNRSASWGASHKEWDARRKSWPAIAYGAPVQPSAPWPCAIHGLLNCS